MRKKTEVPNKRLGKLKGIMAQYEITVSDLAKVVGKTPPSISRANNGLTLYNSNDMLKIHAYLNEKSGNNYSIEDIFFS